LAEDVGCDPREPREIDYVVALSRLHDIFAIQDEISHAIVDALKLKLEIAPAISRARSMEAYDLYLQGLFLSDKSTEEALRKSLGFFERTLDQARAELLTAMELYRAMDMTFWLPETEAALAQVEGR